MRTSAVFGDRPLALGDLRPENELLAAEHRVDRVQHFLFDRRVLGLQVQQGNGNLFHYYLFKGRGGVGRAIARH